MISKRKTLYYDSPFIQRVFIKCFEYDQSFPYWGDWGDPHYPKNWLAPPPPYVPRLFCPKNVDFVIFMQFFALQPKLPQLPPQVDPQWETLTMLVILTVQTDDILSLKSGRLNTHNMGKLRMLH